ncbi:MAG: POTRA domain-containing protein, partial [Blastocatellia bacterium]
MRQTRLTILAGAIAIITASAANSLATTQLQQFLGKTVVSVEIVVEGAPSSDTTEIRDVVTIRPDQPFSTVRIHDSLYRLFRSGLVSAARVEAEASGADGVAIKFIVRPQARIDSVTFQGTQVFTANELRAHVNQLNVGDKLTAGIVLRGVTGLQTFYAAHGYYQAQITSDVKLDPTGTRATVVYAINAGAPARISKLAIEAAGANVDLPIATFPLAVGKPFTDTGLQDEMSSITQVYLSKDYLAAQVKSSVEPDAAANTVAVTITVDSGPLASVEIAGLIVNEKQKRLLFPFYTQGGLDEFSLEDGRRRLLDFAQRQGYFFAEVAGPPKPDLSQPQLTVTYTVIPGNRYRLTDLDIKGVNAIPVKDLISELKTKEATSVPFTAARRGITSNDYLRDDSNRILRRLHDLGYRRAHVDALRGVSPRGDSLIITFDVRQGPRTYIDGVGVKGNLVLTSDQILQKISLKPNDPLETSTINSNSEQLLTAYNQMGYADAQVTPEVEDEGNSDGEDRVRLLYNVSEGPRVKILHVTTHGAGFTSPTRLQKDFYLFKSGDFLRNDKLSETERTLYDTNAFTSVTIHSEPVGRTPAGIQQRDVTVDLAEAKRYLLIYGFGFQSTNGNPTVPGLGFLHGAEGLVQLTDTNLLGKLFSGSIQFRVSPTEALGQISFEDPRPFGVNLPVVVSIFAQQLAELSFSSNRYTAQIQFEKRISQNTIVYFSYNFERISVFNLNPQLLDTNDIQQILAIEQE